MDVFALGIQNRGSSSVIAPNIPAQVSPDDLAHVDCEQCGMCIDACPVGALTSGTYRYKTRPWEMNHVSTICTHCGDGCKTTLGVRSTTDGSEIVRGDNRDKSGINVDFLCNKGRYAFDFANNEDRITQPLVRQPNGEMKPVSWEVALDHVGNKFRELRDTRGGKSIGVIGSNRTTNEESYLLQKFARTVLDTNNIDHHRTADYVAFARALAGTTDRTASLNDTLTAPAIMILGGDPTIQAPATAWNIRSNVRNNRARLYVANSAEIKLRRQAKAFAHIAPFSYGALASFLAGDDSAVDALTHSGADASSFHDFRKAVRAEESLLVLLGSEFRGADLQRLLAFGKTLPNRKFALISDYVNSRGAADMGLLPDLLPGYAQLAGNTTFAEYNTPTTPGLDILEMFEAAGRGELSALYVVGSNPVSRYSVDPAALKDTFVVVQDMFLTETAALADVILPAANLYEKSGSVTNSYGDLQLVSKAGDRAGVRSDFEMIVRIADKMGANMKALVPFGKGTRADMGQSRGAQSGEADRHAVWLSANNMEPKLSPFDPFAILDEIQRLVPGYNLLRLQLLSGNDQHLQPAVNANVLVQIGNRRDLVLPANDTLFTSGTLGRYSTMLSDLQHNESLRPPTGLTQIQTAAD